LAVSAENRVRIAEAVRMVLGSEPCVVFVSSLLRAREIKMATALRAIGWKVILLYKQTTPFTPGAIFDLAIRAAADSELHEIAVQIQPPVCHVFSGAVDEIILQFCRYKPGPVVVDLNDVFCPSMFNYLSERFAPTKECLALADGVCARDLQPRFAERYDGFEINGPTLWFPEYGWKEFSKEPRAARKKDADEIRVVSIGTMTLESQGWYDSGLLALAKMFAEQRIHLHIYPHWFYLPAPGTVFNFNREKDFKDFIELERKTGYVHVHNSLFFDELARELPQYDFGIVSGGCEDLGQKLKFLRQEYMRACYSGRISDFLDARLPVLINREVVFNEWLLRRNEIAVDLRGILALGFREKLLAIKNSQAWAEKVEMAARRFSLSAHAPRLAAFYNRVIALNKNVAYAAVKVGDFAVPANNHRVRPPWRTSVHWITRQVRTIARQLRSLPRRIHNRLFLASR